MIRPRRPATFRSRTAALNEARLLAQLSHPNVVRVFGADRVGGDVGISMELVQGRTLEDLVTQQGPFSAREAMLFGVDVCCALAAVHRARLVHGDVKAQNVMRATGGRTVLMDFGAGYDVKTDEAAGRRLAGTPLYLAPEVFDGEARTAARRHLQRRRAAVPPRHRVVPGRRRRPAPRSGASTRRAPRRMLRDLRPDLPDAFIHVVERATADGAAGAIPDRGELEAALNLALGHGSTQPDTPPLPFRHKLRHRRRRPRDWCGGAGLRPLGRPRATRLRRGDRARGDGQRPRSSVATPVPPPTAATGSRRRSIATRAAATSGSRRAPGSRRGDRLSLQVTSSVPTYVYVVNEDDHGESFLLFPLPGLHAVNPLPADSRHEIPGRVARRAGLLDRSRAPAAASTS